MNNRKSFLTPIEPLTTVEQRIMMAIHGFISQNGYSPKLTEIMQELGWNYRSNLQASLRSMRDKRWIDWKESVSGRVTDPPLKEWA